MKLKYLTMLCAIFLLSSGVISSCSAPTITNISDTSKVDPCAGKKAATGLIDRPLAQQLQGKPVMVDIYASWCPACKNIAPTVTQLKEKYAGKVEFVVLDVSDQSTTTAAVAKAQELGLSDFLAQNKTQTGSLTIFDPATGRILAQHRNNPDVTAYTKILDTALTKS